MAADYVGVEAVADCFAQLMTEVLGYARFAAQGGDWGAFVTSRLGAVHADKLIGIHVNLLAVRRDPKVLASPSPEEAQFLRELDHWLKEETGYQWIQGTRPQTLAFGLTDSPALGQLETIQDGRGLVISLPESATFSSGSADLTPAAQSFLMRMADALRGVDVRIRVEGHTDDRPISGGRYGSNWELSTARASAVVVFLVTEASFAPEQLSAAGYGEFHPRAANDIPERRALNRRVDVVVMPATAGSALDWVAAP